MADPLPVEIYALRKDVQALADGLLIQQELLRIMDEKLNRLLEAATVEQQGDSPLHDLLKKMADALVVIAGRQDEIIDMLRDGHSAVH